VHKKGTVGESEFIIDSIIVAGATRYQHLSTGLSEYFDVGLKASVSQPGIPGELPDFQLKHLISVWGTHMAG
jgi:hypothetical protein